MKKSIVVGLLALCLACFGCTQSTPAEPEVTNKLDLVELERDAEQLAEDISLLSLGPGIEDELDRIQDAYDALPAEIQKTVENYSDFTDVKSAYEDAMDSVQAAIDAIDDIGDVDVNSLADIENAQDLLDAVNPLFKDLVTNQSEIEADLHLYREALSDEAVAYAWSLIQAGRYQDAMKYADNFISEYGSELNSTSDLREVSQTAELYWAYQLYDQNYLGYVQNILDDLEWDTVTDTLESYRSNLQSRLNNYLDSTMPANGTIVSSTISGGYGELTIHSGSSPMLIKIEDYSNSGRYIYVFMRPNSTTSFNVPDGYYYTKYATGDHYFGNTASKPFGPDTSYRQADDLMQFETTRSGNYIYYSTWELTLYAVEGGNMGTHSIDGL